MALSNQDLISCLPNLCRLLILSFLPMKDAFKAHVLSKNWNGLCRSLLILKFDQPHSMNIKDFRDMVDQVLLYYDVSNIHEFSLSFTLDTAVVSHDHLNAWIYFALRHKVQHSKLWLHSDMNEELPFSLFISRTLSSLDLGYIYNMTWPDKIYLPSLKALRLERMEFEHESTTKKLFSVESCPILQRLTIIECIFDDEFGTLTISNSSLKWLLIFLNGDLDVALSIPSLDFIEYYGLSPPDITAETLSSLSNATLNFSLPDDDEDYLFFESAVEVLKGLLNVHSLTLDKSFVENLARDRNLLNSFPPAYLNLSHLCLETCLTNNHVQVIIFLLKRAPYLRTLEIEWENGVSSDKINTREHLRCAKVTMECLRKVDILGFEGSESEMDLVQYIFENASILEKMVLRGARTAERKEVVLKRLSSFRKLSPHVSISPK